MEIKELKITAKPGLWLHASSKKRSLGSNGKEQEFIVENKMKLDGRKQIILGQPPMFFYPIDVRPDQTGETDQVNIGDNKDRQWKVKITKSKVSNKGPDLIIDIDETSTITATLTGYITTIAFEGYCQFKIDPKDFVTGEYKRSSDNSDENEAIRRRDEILENDELNSSKNETTVLSASFEAKGKFQPGINHIQFRFTSAGIKEFVDQNHTSILESKKTYFTNRSDVHMTVWKKDIEDRLKAPASKASKKGELENMFNEIHELKATFRQHQKDKYKSCDFCKAVKSPGFVWDSCKVSDRLGKVSCLQFKKDALMSCDTHCLAKCDISKFDGKEKAKKLRHDINKKSTILSKRSSETAIYDELSSAIADCQNALNRFMFVFMAESLSISSLDESVGSKLASISTDWLDFSDFERENLLMFKMKYKDGTGEDKKFPIDGSITMKIADYLLEQTHGEQFADGYRKEKDVQRQYGECKQQIENWFIENREWIKQLRRGAPTSSTQARSKRSLPSKRQRVFDNIKVRESPSSWFPDEDLFYDKLFKKHAPWNVLETSNPFVMINTTVNKAKRYKVSKSASYCTNRRNRIRDYKDMVKYMKSWSDSFDHARDFFMKSKTHISNGVENMRNQFVKKRTLGNDTSSLKKSKVDKVSEKWANRLTSGFSTWENEFSKQLSSFYSFGPKMMWNEMNAIFTPGEFESLQSYLQSTPSNALSRSIDQPLQQLAQNLLTGFSTMNTLDDNRNLVNRMQSMIDQAEKSDHSCHDEL